MEDSGGDISYHITGGDRLLTNGGDHAGPWPPGTALRQDAGHQRPLSRPYGSAEDADERHHDEREADGPAIDAAAGAKPPADAAIGIGRHFRRGEGSFP